MSTVYDLPEGLHQACLESSTSS